MSFEAFHLGTTLNTNLKTAGYEVPTPIQQQAIPHVMQGRDVLGLAQTGTGKTAAFALPILHKLSHGGPRGKVRALILAPTRELAEQIHESFGMLGRHTNLRSATVYGGVGQGPQIHALQGRAEIIVACPGRLLDLIGQRHANLSGVEVLVLDEADHMFDMGFLPDVRKILKALPHARQNLLFSATMPGDIRTLAHECLKDPVTVQVKHEVPLETVSHTLYPVPSHLKTALLLELLRPAHLESVLIFTRTKHRAKRLGLVLEKAGYKCASLQGNLSQNRRKEALDGFRSGKYDILVATDIAARGIDVSQITHVINFDIPDTPEAYTHRIGRTGRAAKTGDAYTFISEEDNGMVHLIEKRMNTRIERRKLPDFNYGAPAPAEHSFKRGGHHPHSPSRSREGAGGRAGSGGSGFGRDHHKAPAPAGGHTWANRGPRRSFKHR